MAKYFSNPNPYSETLNRKFTHKFFLLMSTVSGVALAYWLTQTDNLFYVALGYFIVVIFVYSSYKIFIEMGKNDRGELAEIKVKRLLLELSDQYSIYQNVPIKEKLDIDFVIIGLYGIFAVEVKSHFQVGMFNRRRFINQTFAETMGLKEYLQESGVKTFIHPILVFSRAHVNYSAPRNGVCVTSSEHLLTYIAQAKKYSFDKEKAEKLVHNLYISES